MIEAPQSDPKAQIRNAILLRVRQGSMSTRDADLWAAENGETFSQEPDQARFDPLKQSEWTLPMTAAWIISRSLDEVRDQWDDFRREKYAWAPCKGVGIISGAEIGSELQRCETSSLRRVLGAYDNSRVAKPAAWSPKREFELALRSNVGPGVLADVGAFSGPCALESLRSGEA